MIGRRRRAHPLLVRTDLKLYSRLQKRARGGRVRELRRRDLCLLLIPLDGLFPVLPNVVTLQEKYRRI